jgi:hypothetical protein
MQRIEDEGLGRVDRGIGPCPLRDELVGQVAERRRVDGVRQCDTPIGRNPIDQCHRSEVRPPVIGERCLGFGLETDRSNVAAELLRAQPGRMLWPRPPHPCEKPSNRSHL